MAIRAPLFRQHCRENKWPIPFRPWVAITIESTPNSTAALSISLAASPLRASNSNCTPLSAVRATNRSSSALDVVSGHCIWFQWNPPNHRSHRHYVQQAYSGGRALGEFAGHFEHGQRNYRQNRSDRGFS